jgi:hypothetical protein
MLWHHPKRDMQADLRAAYSGAMLSDIGSLYYKDGGLCTAHLIIRKLVCGYHDALATCQTLIGRRTSGAKFLCP